MSTLVEQPDPGVARAVVERRRTEATDLAGAGHSFDDIASGYVGTGHQASVFGPHEKVVKLGAVFAPRMTPWPLGLLEHQRETRHADEDDGSGREDDPLGLDDGEPPVDHVGLRPRRTQRPYEQPQPYPGGQRRSDERHGHGCARRVGSEPCRDGDKRESDASPGERRAFAGETVVRSTGVTWRDGR